MTDDKVDVKYVGTKEDDYKIINIESSGYTRYTKETIMKYMNEIGIPLAVVGCRDGSVMGKLESSGCNTVIYGTKGVIKVDGGVCVGYGGEGPYGLVDIVIKSGIKNEDQRYEVASQIMDQPADKDKRKCLAIIKDPIPHSEGYKEMEDEDIYKKFKEGVKLSPEDLIELQSAGYL